MTIRRYRVALIMAAAATADSRADAWAVGIDGYLLHWRPREVARGQALAGAHLTAGRGHHPGCHRGIRQLCAGVGWREASPSTAGAARMKARQ